MGIDRAERVEGLLNGALDLQPGLRSGFLRQQGADAESVVQEVESLLASYDPEFLAVPLHLPSLLVGITEETGTDGLERAATIGPYKILRLIGEGGMARVYEAEQVAPLRRRVALKLIKQSLDSRQMLLRFESERQALARLDHPFITKVFDAGAAEDGRPYFAMEYVQGQPITRHCDARRLTIHARLKLFLDVCKAVQHAHTNAILHRDLKPSNVLVADREGEAVPKVIDFGVAKALDHHPTEQSMFTEAGQLVGTPEYMSPEQLEETGKGVDARTDVYGLGVLLYELLAGALPFESRTGGWVDFYATLRKVREQDPPRPSTRLRELPDAQAVAAARRSDAVALCRTLRGDLDAIVLHALEKDRENRYASVADLAEDIERYLEQRPVVACPPGLPRRVAKFSRRHPFGVSGAAGAIVVLLAFAGISAAQLAEVKRERDRTREAMGYLMNVFDSWLARGAPPRPSLKPTIDAPHPRPRLAVEQRQLLDLAAAGLSGIEDPALRAEVGSVIGRIYAQSGLFTQAIAVMQQSLEAQKLQYGDDHAKIAATLGELSDLHRGNGDAEQARRAAEEALAILEGSPTPPPGEVAGNLRRIGLAWAELGRLDEARESLERSAAASLAVESMRIEAGPTFELLADLAWRARDADQAVQYIGKAQAIWKAFFPEHPRLLLNEVLVLASEGRRAEALGLLEQALDGQLAPWLARDNPDLLMNHPGLDPLRHEPRFTSLVESFRRRAGLAAPPTVRFVAPDVGHGVEESQVLHVKLEASGASPLAEVRLVADSGFARTFTAPPFEASFIVPRGARRIELRAHAVDIASRESDTVRSWDVVPARRVRVSGRVLGPSGPVVGATVRSLDGAEAQTDPAGTFVIDVSAVHDGQLALTAAARTEGTHWWGTTSVLIGTREGLDIGDVAVGPLAAVGTRVDVGPRPLRMAVGDLDSDGLLDVALTNAQKRGVTLLLGQVEGGLRPVGEIEGDPLGTAGPIALADLDRDGALDLVGGSRDFGDSVFVALGRGDATFDPPRRYAVGINHEQLVITDVNGDDRLDTLVASGFNYPVAVLFGAGDGSLGLVRTVDSPRWNAHARMSVGDANRDGLPDLLMSAPRGALQFWRGSPDGSFRPANRFELPEEDWAAAMGDFDGDTVLDVAAGGASETTVWRGDGDGGFRKLSSFDPCRPGDHVAHCIVQRLEAGDVDLDGDLDLVALSPRDRLHVLLGRGDGTFAFDRSYEVGRHPREVKLADFNGDDLGDLAVIETKGTLSIQLGLGGGRFQEAPGDPYR